MGYDTRMPPHPRPDKAWNIAQKLTASPRSFINPPTEVVMTDRSSATPEDLEILDTYVRYWQIETRLIERRGCRWWRIYIRLSPRVHNWQTAMRVAVIRGPIGHGFNRSYQRAVRFAVRRAQSWWWRHQKRLPLMQPRHETCTWNGTADEPYARGLAHERRALALLQDMLKRYTWMREARASTFEEDKNGIDIVVSSTAGPLYLQVKSSVRGRDKFYEKGYPRDIGVVIVNERVEDWRIRDRMAKILLRLWSERREGEQRQTA